MSDKFRTVSPVNVTFSIGEQPTAAKLSGWAQQIDTGFTKIEEALGDLWSDSHPIFPNSVNTAIGTWAYQPDGTIVSGTLEQRHLQILNLARLIGPASVLNPRSLTGNTVTFTEAIPGGQNEFKTKYAPITNVTFSSGTYFASSEATVAEVSVLGEYHIDTTTGKITYICDIAGSPSNITYDVDLRAANAGDTYEGASFNVIPDPNQSTKCTVTGPSSGKYTIALPIATAQQADWNDSSATLDVSEDSNSAQQLALPTVWATEFITGEIIPDGLVKIWDKDASAFLEGQTFYYEDQLSIKVDDAIVLDTGDTGRYSLVVVGTDISRTLDHLRNRFHKHTHTGEDGSRPMDHSDLSGRAAGTVTIPDLNGGDDVIVGWTRDSGEISGNEHPQYLHRAGADDSELKNAMFGDLLFAPTEHDSGDIFHTEDSPTTYSSKLKFLHPSGGPQIYGLSTASGVALWLAGQDNVKIVAADTIYLDAPEVEVTEIIRADNTFRIYHGSGDSLVVTDDSGNYGGRIEAKGTPAGYGEIKTNGRVLVKRSIDATLPTDGMVVSALGYTAEAFGQAQATSIWTKQVAGTFNAGVNTVIFVNDLTGTTPPFGEMISWTVVLRDDTTGHYYDGHSSTGYGYYAQFQDALLDYIEIDWTGGSINGVTNFTAFVTIIYTTSA